MNKNGLFSKPATLMVFAVFAEIFGILSVYFCLTDDFAHSILLLFDYVLVFILIFSVKKAFSKGEKEIVKAGTASLFTACFLVFVKTFIDIIYLNNYYIFSKNYVATIIGVITILIFVLFVFAYITHFKINISGASDSKRVQGNKTILVFISILCLVNAAAIYYNDILMGRKIEYYLICTYCMYFFVNLILACIEVLINNFRIAKEKGNLEAFATKLVGKNAARVSVGKAPKKKPVKKANKKARK